MRYFSPCLRGALFVFFAMPVLAQPPYPIDPDTWLRIQRSWWDRHQFPYGRWTVPHEFHISRIDQQFIPQKMNVGMPVDSSSVRQSFASVLPDGKVQTIHVYLEQPGSLGLGAGGIGVTLELYEGQTYDSIAPKSTLLAKATQQIANPSIVPVKQWVPFTLNSPVQNWLNRRFVIVLSSAGVPSTAIRWIGDNGNPYPRGQAAPGAAGPAKDMGVDLGFKVINLK